jgi:single-stranded DNA-binding protein
MQVFGNVGTEPEVKVSRATSKRYAEFRLCESHKGLPGESCWFTVRVMNDRPLNLVKGDFVKVTGRLKTDFYLSREGKPTGTLLIIAFEAAKISKPSPSVTKEPAAAAPAPAAAKTAATATTVAAEAMDWC